MVNPAYSEQPAAFAACDGLVSSYRYLCRRGARKYWRPGLERCDLEQVAAIGLIKAARRFDPRTSTPFEAYAWLNVVGELGHYVRDFERIVRVPRRLRALEASYQRAHEACASRQGREPSDAEVAREMGILEQTVGEIRHARETAAPVSLEDRGTLALADGSLPLEDRAIVDAALRELNDVERRIVVGTYVLRLTSQELGRRLGLSPRRVSRLRVDALARLQSRVVS